MKLTFHLNATFFDCILRIRCENGFNVAYRMTATAPLGGALIDTVTVEVPENTCEVMVYPQFCEGLKEEVKSFRGDGFWDTLAVKALGKAADSTLRNGTLHTALTYRLDLRERLGNDLMGDGTLHLTLTERSYTLTAEWVSELLELYPVCYTFFELSEGENAAIPAHALGVNRKHFLRFARKIILLQCAGWDVGVLGLAFYPFLMGRVKRLSRPRPVLRRLKKLYRLPPEKRAEKLDEEPNVRGEDVFGEL